MKNLRSIKKTSTKEAVIKSLQDYIVKQSLRVGDALPSETDLATHLNVSRNILREAMQYFKTLGIIASRPKTGAYIAQLTPVNPFQGFFPFFTDNSTRVKEIGQLRQVVEIGAVDLFVKFVTVKQLEQLEQLAQRLRTATIAERKTIDVEFHSILLDSCNNSLLSSLIPLVVDFFQESALSNPVADISERVYQEHMAIINALRERDPDQLRRAFRNHYHI